MKKLLLSLLILSSFFISNNINAQTKITDFPTYVGDPAGGWVPIVIGGINRKIDASLTGYNRIDSFSINLGSSTDTFYLWKNGAIAFFKLYPHSSGGGGGSGSVKQVNMTVPTGLNVSSFSIVDSGTFAITTSLNGIVHASGGGFSGGQILNADVHDVAFSKITGTPTTKAGYNITDVMAYSDTASLSNRINLKVNTSDTSNMLLPYLRKIDTASLSNRFNSKLNLSDTNAMLIPYARNIAVVKYADTASMLSVYLKSINGVKYPDTASMLSTYQKSITAMKYTDSASMLSPYLRKIDTISLNNRIAAKVNVSDTLNMLSPYLRKIDTSTLSARINIKVNYTDTANMLNTYLHKFDTTNMLSPYLRKIDTSTLSARINLRVNYTDTATMLSPYERASVANAAFYPLNLNPKNYLTAVDSAHVVNGLGYVPAKASTTLTINGQTFDLTQNRSWSVSGSLAGQSDVNFTSLADGQLVKYNASTSKWINFIPTYLSTVDTGNIPSFSVKVRGLFNVGTGLSYNPTTGTIINLITNTNQLTNGAGFISTITGSAVTTALGYTPVNPNGTSAQYITGNGNFAAFMFNNLSDVTIASPSNGQLIKFNSGTSKWTNFTPNYFQPTDTVNTLATKTNIIKDTVIGFQIGDGGSLTPGNGQTAYTNPALVASQLLNVVKGDTVIPTFTTTGGGPYVTFNNGTGTIILHNTTFTTGQVVTVQYIFGNGQVAGGGGGGGGGNIISVFGRTGAVTAQAGDYSSFYFAAPTGTTGQYIRGDGSTATFPTLATVATSGSYTDLINKPVIPSNTNQLVNGSGFITGINSSQIVAALGFTPFNASGSSTQYTKGDGTFGTTDTTMIPNFFTKVRSEFSSGTGIAISNGIITNTITNTNQLTNGAGFLTSVSSGNVISALGYTPANQASTITINGTSFDISQSRSYNISYSNLIDVNLATLTDGQMVKWNNSTSRWVNFTPNFLAGVDTTNIPNFSVKVRSLFSAGSGISYNSSTGLITNTINNTNQLTNGAGFLSSIDTNNIANFFIKVRSEFTAGTGISISNGIITNTINNTNQLTNGAGFLSSVDTTNIPTFSVKVRSLFSGISGVIYSNGQSKADTALLATQYDNGLKVNISDTSTMLTKYLRKSDTTAMLSPYVRTVTANATYATITNDNLKVKYTDTAAMLSPYARKNFISANAPLSYSSSTGIISVDTFSAITHLVTITALKDTLAIADTLHIAPQGTAGLQLGYGSGTDTFKLKKIVQGANVTLTQNTDSSITIAASSGFANPMTTSQDLIVGGSSGAPGRLGVGANGTFLGVSGGAVGYFTPPGAVSSVAATNSSLVISPTTGNVLAAVNPAFNINWSVGQSFTAITASSTLTLSGTTYNSNLTKMDVMIQDTTTGIVYRKSAQYVDTTGKVDGSDVKWSNSAGNFIMGKGGVSADSVAKTGASTIATFAVGAANGTFRIGGYLNVTAITVDVIKLQVTYTDENNNSQTQIFYPLGATSGGFTGISTTGNNNFPVTDIRVKASTTITVSTILTTGTGSITYDAGTSIQQLR